MSFKYYLSIFKHTIKALLNCRKTYCHLLWDSVFIDQDGKVFSCCHYGPVNIGNIYRNRLEDIWKKSLALKFFRFVSLARCLHCFANCNLLSKKEKTSLPKYPLLREYPKLVWILFGEFCNQRCIMCWQKHDSNLMIKKDILKRNIDWSRVKEIELQGGEILAMNDAKEFYLWLTKEMGKKVNLITNGMLINDEWADYLLRGSHWVEVSVNAATKETHEIVNQGSNFDKVISNIKKLIALKQSTGANTDIIFHFTIVPQNIHEMIDAIGLADNLGCDVIRFGYSHQVQPLFKANKELPARINNSLIRLINSRDLKVKIDPIRLEYLGIVNGPILNLVKDKITLGSHLTN